MQDDRETIRKEEEAEGFEEAEELLEEQASHGDESAETRED